MKIQSGDLEHIISFTPVDHGSSMRLTFYVKGNSGAVQFLILTGWRVPYRDRREGYSGLMPADLGYHAKKPQYEDQSLMMDDCEYTDGPCYYDGSSLNAEKPYEILVTKGEDALWEFLESYYHCVFHGAPYPGEEA